MATTEEALSILGRLAEELMRRRSDVQRFDEYYRGGRGKLVFASDKFSEYFSDRYKNFTDNWCGVVADAPTERLKVTGFRAVDDEGGLGEVDTETWRIWRENDADYFSDQAFLEAIIGKRAYQFTWGGAEEDTPYISFEHPLQAIVGYDEETRARRAGLKMWVDEWSDMEFATLYLPDEVWKFQRKRIVEGKTDAGLHVVARAGLGGWQPRQVGDEPWPLRNPMGVVPLAELPNRPRLVGEPMSDIAGVTVMQDAINLMWAYLLNAADYASFPQRVVMGAEKPKVPVLDDQGQVVGTKDVDLKRFGVDRVVWLEDPNATIGEWKAANLELYTSIIESEVSHVAAQSRTPPHYLMSKIVNANAETLKTAETGLVKRTEEKTETYGRGLRQGAADVAIAQNPGSDDARRKARSLRAGRVMWADIEIRSEAQAADAAQKYHAMGFPLKYISRKLGMSPDEIDEVMEMRREEMRERSELDPLGELARNSAGQADAEPGE